MKPLANLSMKVRKNKINLTDTKVNRKFKTYDTMVNCTKKNRFQRIKYINDIDQKLSKKLYHARKKQLYRQFARLRDQSPFEDQLPRFWARSGSASLLRNWWNKGESEIGKEWMQQRNENDVEGKWLTGDGISDSALLVVERALLDLEILAVEILSPLPDRPTKHSATPSWCH